MGGIKITKVIDYIGDYYILSGEGKSWYGIWCLSVRAACSAVGYVISMATRHIVQSSLKIQSSLGL